MCFSFRKKACCIPTCTCQSRAKHSLIHSIQANAFTQHNEGQTLNSSHSMLYSFTPLARVHRLNHLNMGQLRQNMNADPSTVAPAPMRRHAALFPLQYFCNALRDSALSPVICKSQAPHVQCCQTSRGDFMFRVALTCSGLGVKDNEDFY